VSIQQELCALKRAHKLLKRETVHQWAEKHSSSAIYKALEWNDAEGAYQYRLLQIGNLIQIHCRDVDGTRTLVSLSVDRVSGGGYRSMREVISDKKMREILLADALEDLRRMEDRYKLLKDLVSGIRKIRKREEVRAKAA
jgi:hypothetical protein